MVTTQKQRVVGKEISEEEVRRMKLISVQLPEAYVKGLENLVQKGFYPNRSEAIRYAIRDLLKKELWEKRV